MLQGKKTYLAAAAYVAFAVGGYLLDQHDTNRMMELIMQAAMIAGLRKGIG